MGTYNRINGLNGVPGTTSSIPGNSMTDFIEAAGRANRDLEQGKLNLDQYLEQFPTRPTNKEYVWTVFGYQMPEEELW